MTDTGGSRPSTDEPADRSSFRFDLGGALARLGGALDAEELRREQAPSAPLPAPAPSGGPLTPPPLQHRAPASQPPPPPPPGAGLPQLERRERRSTPLTADAAPAASPSTSPTASPSAPAPTPAPTPASVDPAFDDIVLPRRITAAVPAPAMPVTPVTEQSEARSAREATVDAAAVAPAPAPIAPARPNSRKSVFEEPNPAPELPSRSTAIRPVEQAAVLPPQIASPPEGLPTLPVSNPAAPPAIVTAIETAPSTPDVNAFRSAQLRASRQQRQGRLFGRSMLAFMLVGGLVAAALFFGRSYLFPTEWDATLTPIVDQIQQERGGEFDHTVALVTQPADEYATTMLDLTIGRDWSNDVPEWRALGLAEGNALPEEVAASLALVRVAVYDPAADVIYRSADADPAALEDALRAILVEIFEQQQGVEGRDEVVETPPSGVLGVSSPQRIVERAVDHHLLGLDATAASIAQLPAESGVPIPIRYELAAIESLGAAALSATGVDPAAVSYGVDYPSALYGVLDDRPDGVVGAPLRPDDVSLAEPVAWGVDDWSLVWGARLPATTVDRVVQAVVADSYRPIERSGVTCIVGVFQASDEGNATIVLSAMLRWVAEAPAGVEALAFALDATRVQVEACDPGPGAVTSPDPLAVDGLIARQLARLTG